MVFPVVLGLGSGGEGDNRGWDGWMASPTRWAWVWVNSRSWWWTRRPGVLRFMGSQRVGHNWATELTWTDKLHLFSLREQKKSRFSGLTTLDPQRVGHNWATELTWTDKLHLFSLREQKRSRFSGLTTLDPQTWTKQSELI